MNDAEWEPMVDINYVSHAFYYIYWKFLLPPDNFNALSSFYNQKGIVRGTILGLNRMGKHKGGKGGTIVNMSSIVGLQSNPLAPIYAGTQFAIVGFTLSLQVKMWLFINK